MKKYYSILLIAMALAFSIASCQKNDESLAYDNEIEISGSNTLLRGDDDHIMGIDPSPLYSYLDSLYGDWFYINNDSVKKATSSSDVIYRPVGVWVFPCKIVSYMYFTVVFNTSAQIIGTYIISYHPTNLNDASESLFYEFEVFDPEGDAYPNCFTGSAITDYNYPPQPDTFTIYNWGIDIPSTYPYHLFDNIAPGTVNLETCEPFDNNYPPYIMIALRCGFTIYANYCGS